MYLRLVRALTAIVGPSASCGGFITATVLLCINRSVTLYVCSCSIYITRPFPPVYFLHGLWQSTFSLSLLLFTLHLFFDIVKGASFPLKYRLPLLVPRPKEKSQVSHTTLGTSHATTTLNVIGF